jgi:hypothetical protein
MLKVLCQINVILLVVSSSPSRGPFFGRNQIAPLSPKISFSLFSRYVDNFSSSYFYLYFPQFGFISLLFPLLFFSPLLLFSHFMAFSSPFYIILPADRQRSTSPPPPLQLGWGARVAHFPMNNTVKVPMCEVNPIKLFLMSFVNNFSVELQF